MSSVSQGLIWESIVQQINLEQLVNYANKPDEFQVELASLLNTYTVKTIAEIGCATGVTSLMLKDSFDKTLLDINPGAIELARQLFDSYGKKAEFFVDDMFNMNFSNESFELLFNSGVIEHFSYHERVKALQEYSRVLKPDGVMIIAFPNHYSFLYRIAYLILNWRGRWQYPKEYKIYDLGDELNESGLYLEKRVILAKKTALWYASFNRVFGKLMSVADKIFKFEGYLTVLVIRNQRQCANSSIKDASTRWSG